MNLYSSGTVGTGNLSALCNTAVSTSQGFRLYTNISKCIRTKQSVSNIVDGRFSGVSVRQGSTVRLDCTIIGWVVVQ